ncbi:hypothetical protein V6N13_143655 [Hibiscus sabdariffa]
MLFPKPIAFLLPALLSIVWLNTHQLGAATLPQDEVNVLNQVAKTMGSNDWSFDAGSCNVSEQVNMVDMRAEKNITCTCQNGTCHVTHIVFKLQSLPGVLPSEIVNLPYLKVVDFAYNSLSGTIPPEWASMQLEFISVFGNRLSGSIPTYLGNITSLRYLDLEANRFSGQVPPEIGKLVNLGTLRMSSNRLEGNLPVQLAELENLTDL